MDPVDLRTGRLLLRAPAETDLAQIVALCQDPSIPATTRVPSPFTGDDAEAFLRDMVVPGWATGTRCEWSIRPVGAPSTVIGSVSLSGIADGRGEVGFWLGSASRGRGFMVEAVGAVLDWAFAPAPAGRALARVQWRALATNAPSAAVARRSGFRFEGRSRSSVLHRGARHDEFLAGVLADDDRRPADGWPV